MITYNDHAEQTVATSRLGNNLWARNNVFVQLSASLGAPAFQYIPLSQWS